MKKLLAVIVLFLLVGCTPVTTKLNPAILLPEDRIYTVPAGQQIKVTLDGKPLDMVFPLPMKLVSADVLIRQEQKANEDLSKATKASADKNKWIGIFGALAAIIPAGMAAYSKVKAKT